MSPYLIGAAIGAAVASTLGVAVVGTIAAVDIWWTRRTEAARTAHPASIRRRDLVKAARWN